jgi:hypothetical protein
MSLFNNIKPEQVRNIILKKCIVKLIVKSKKIDSKNYLRNKRRTGGITQVIEHLLS